ncbi:MAG: tetratricopeptide repeat protein [Bacteroidia bacterium]|nr:tetratricopeptide repeat protein [Bacteroidia bacterium]
MDGKIDSLKFALIKSKEDSNKIKTLWALATLLKVEDPDTAIILNLQALKLAEKVQWRNGLVRALRKTAALYSSLSNYPKSLEYYFAALKISEENEEPKIQADIISSIGIVYFNLSDYKKQLEYALRALKIFESCKDKSKISGELNNIGLAYFNMADYKKALNYYALSLKIKKETGGVNSVTLMNIGGVCFRLAEYDSSLKYYREALKNFEENGWKNSASNCLGNMGNLFTRTGNYKEAETHLKKALAISTELNAVVLIIEQESFLSELYDTIGKSQLAFDHYKRFVSLSDSLNSVQNQKKQIQAEMNYEFGKKEAVMKEQQEKERVVAAEKSRFQKIVISSVLICLLLVIAFSFFVFRTLKKTRLQKYIIEEKQREILDSIRYAKRIQNALLTSEKYIERVLRRNKPA